MSEGSTGHMWRKESNFSEGQNDKPPRFHLGMNKRLHVLSFTSQWKSQIGSPFRCDVDACITKIG